MEQLQEQLLIYKNYHRFLIDFAIKKLVTIGPSTYISIYYINFCIDLLMK